MTDKFDDMNPVQLLEEVRKLHRRINNRMWLDELAREVREVNRANGWNVLQSDEWADQYKIAGIVALIHSEVSEALEAFRHNDRENFIEELADIVIRVVDCAGGLTGEFTTAVLAKVDKNRQRALRHGGKRI